MRLTEFADPNLYIPPGNAAADFANRLSRLWPDHPADDLASPVRGSRNQPLVKPRKLLDEL
jgi:hypothetical protein